MPSAQHPRWRRRTLLKSGLAVAALGAPPIIRARGETPVRIGMVDPLTGILSALAASEVEGAKYAVERLNKKNGILGRPIELLVEDSANDVGTGVQKTRKLIERDKVDVIFGDVNSGIAYAMSQVTSELKVFHIVPGGHTDPITGTDCKWNVFRICNTTSMDAAASPATLSNGLARSSSSSLPTMPMAIHCRKTSSRTSRRSAASIKRSCCRSTHRTSAPR